MLSYRPCHMILTSDVHTLCVVGGQVIADCVWFCQGISGAVELEERDSGRSSPR